MCSTASNSTISNGNEYEYQSGKDRCCFPLILRVLARHGFRYIILLILVQSRLWLCLWRIHICCLQIWRSSEETVANK